MDIKKKLKGMKAHPAPEKRRLYTAFTTNHFEEKYRKQQAMKQPSTPLSQLLEEDITSPLGKIDQQGIAAIYRIFGFFRNFILQNVGEDAIDKHLLTNMFETDAHATQSCTLLDMANIIEKPCRRLLPVVASCTSTGRKELQRTRTGSPGTILDSLKQRYTLFSRLAPRHQRRKARTIMALVNIPQPIQTQVHIRKRIK